METKQNYDAPEVEVILMKIENDLLQVSKPTGDVNDPGNDGDD